MTWCLLLLLVLLSQAHQGDKCCLSGTLGNTWNPRPCNGCLAITALIKIVYVEGQWRCYWSYNLTKGFRSGSEFIPNMIVICTRMSKIKF